MRAEGPDLVGSIGVELYLLLREGAQALGFVTLLERRCRLTSLQRVRIRRHTVVVRLHALAQLVDHGSRNLLRVVAQAVACCVLVICRESCRRGGRRGELSCECFL